MARNGQTLAERSSYQIHFKNKDNVSSSIKGKRVFTREDGASAHCQVDNMVLLEQVAFDWLDEIFDYQ
jgi:hypothetical protein